MDSTDERRHYKDKHNKEQLKVLLDLWSLTDLGKLSEWIDDDRLNLEAPGHDTVLLQLKVRTDCQAKGRG